MHEVLVRQPVPGNPEQPVPESARRSRNPLAAAARRSMSASVMDPRVVGETPAREAAKRGSS